VAIHDRMTAEFASQGVRLERIYVCPHAPERGCACRKPQPGMLERAATELGIDRSNSVMIGDHHTDVLAAHAFGCASILVGGRVADPEARPTAVANDLQSAVDLLLSTPAEILGPWLEPARAVGQKGR
jgi:D-glycero-D-manno-heptose 1,7-bisphosphate phosphatase